MQTDSAPERYDKIDRAILAKLQQDGRIANVDLADAVKLSPSACLRRVKAMEADGLIAGYRAELDRERAGLGLMIFVSVKVQQHSKETAAMIENALTDVPNVIGCYVVSGEADFLVQAVLPDLPSYEQLLLRRILGIDAVTDVRSTFVIRAVEHNGPLPVAQLR